MTVTSTLHTTPTPRHLLTLRDLTRDQLLETLSLAAQLKKAPTAYKPLEGKTLAMIFEKSSTRTRVSFEVGMYQLGGHALMLPSNQTQLGRSEPISDSAKVIGRYCDVVMIRTFGHDLVEAWAQSSPVPVINALTDLYHPCQLLADLLTCREHLKAGLERPWEALSVAWVGDGNNMAHSWVEAAALLGFELRLACPEGYSPNEAIMRYASERGARVTLTRDPREAVRGVDMVTTDVWTSMGQEEETQARLKAFHGYEVNREMMGLASEEAIFLHCLPAHRGEEVSAEVIDGPQSVVWDEAENRLHAQKALLVTLVAPSWRP
jgi:ornithine carbamoyltransferase